MVYTAVHCTLYIFYQIDNSLNFEAIFFYNDHKIIFFPLFPFFTSLISYYGQCENCSHSLLAFYKYLY